MPRFALDPNATQGAKMPDGTTYYPSRSGSIDVDSRKHVEQLRAPNSAKNLGLIIEMKGMPTNTPGKQCENCLFSAWAWSTKCPRCGLPLDEVAKL
jgi:hypothetical protein